MGDKWGLRANERLRERHHSNYWFGFETSYHKSRQNEQSYETVLAYEGW
jgi:hypothetical protein